MIISCLPALFLASYLVWSSPVYSKTTEAFHRRNVFYAGGQYVFNETLGGTILVNQMYIEQLTPINGVAQRYPLVFLHGGGISGTVSTESCFHSSRAPSTYDDGVQQWLNKPDGNRGWASFFLERGYEVFIVDLWSVGRSTPQNTPALLFGATTEVVQLAFTAPEIYKKYYQAQFHTQWPGVGHLVNCPIEHSKSTSERSLI